MTKTAFIIMWFSDARIYQDGNRIIMEIHGRKFMAQLDAFQEIGATSSEVE